jgi:exo-beta-1,3-glucanase (GH17 family)
MSRRYSFDSEPLFDNQQYHSQEPSYGYGHQQLGTGPGIHPPAPPPHRGQESRPWGQDSGYDNDPISPGADNFSEHASGGMVGLARGVADANARESGIEAMRNTPGYNPGMQMRGGAGFDHGGSDWEGSSYSRSGPRQEPPHSSLAPLGAAAFPPGMATPQSRSEVSRSPHSFYHEPYVDNPPNHDNPFNRYSRSLDPSLGVGHFNPNDIADDGDDGLEYRQRNRGSMLSLGHNSERSAAVAGGVAGGAAGGVLGALGLRKTSGQSGAQYNAVQDSYGASSSNPRQEKSAWLKQQSSGNKKLRLLVGILVAVLIIGGIAGGIVGSLLSKKNSSNSSTPSGQSAVEDTTTNGDLDKNSAEIKKLLNNKNLHKVFPGMDYTPMYTQYPDCLSYPASQNNVTRDLAVLSQLTNTIRLYGTDCNQTELLLHSIDQLGLNGTMKVWMGVWLDSNATTNARQLAQMYDIFKKHGSASFQGVIVGNEVLFRQDMTATQLGTVITGVKSNLTAMGINIPVASSDLGDNWSANPTLANEVDILMANIHPFFAGVTAAEASAWTWNFWQTHDLILKSDISKNYISETGWPSTGGTDCGGATTCTTGSVAGITEMNTFMSDWVCASLTNGTQYFWFEAFDEPWKIKYNEAGKEWEDKWGLMDVNRNLKDGVVIPSCGGKTIS